MAIPCKMGPMGDLLDFPYKDHLVAYYDGSFHLIPGRAYTDATETVGATIIAYPKVNPLTILQCQLYFGDGVHPYLRLNFAASYTSSTMYAATRNRIGNSYSGITADENRVVGAGIGTNTSDTTLYVYSYAPSGATYSKTGATNMHDNGKSNSAINIKFGCCFDRRLSREEFNEVAKWILAINF